MKRLVFLVATILTTAISIGEGAIVSIALSPGAGLALNLGANQYTRDHGIGLSGLNEPGIFTVAGSGNTVGAGISYNDVSNLLTFDMAYGSAFGFADLVGNLTVMHIHGPGSVNFPSANTNGGVVVDLAPFHTAAGPKSGRITGSTTLSAVNETRLFDNQLYVNIHSTVQTGGEIRGQLVVVPEPSSALLGLLGGASLLARRRRR